MSVTRRAALLLPLLAAACAGPAPRQDFPPLGYGYLTKLQLNVANVEVAPPPPPTALEAQDPAPPGAALVQMATDRLVAGGSLGRAVFTVEEASIGRVADGLEGVFAVRLDVQTSDGKRAGFAEARVTRRLQGFGDDLRGGLYDLTRQMMDDMNVEFEFQVRRSLRDWLQVSSPEAAPTPVRQQPLAAPGR